MLFKMNKKDLVKILKDFDLRLLKIDESLKRMADRNLKYDEDDSLVVLRTPEPSAWSFNEEAEYVPDLGLTPY